MPLPKGLAASETRHIPLQSHGARFVETLDMNPVSIFVPQSKKELRNFVRFHFDPEHAQTLAESFSRGIDPAQPVPVIMKLATPNQVDGVVYTYILIAGFHRQRAILRNGYESYAYDLYEFGVDGVSQAKAITTFQLKENDKMPSMRCKKDEIINATASLVSQGLLENNEVEIQAYIDDVASNYKKQSRTAMARKVIKQCGSYQDYVTFDFKQCQSFLGQYRNYESGTVVYQTGWEFDETREKRGATVLGGYEIKAIPTAAEYFLMQGQESYFIGHTPMPKNGETADEARQRIYDQMKLTEAAMIKAVRFYDENGRFPWDLEAWMAQDNLNGEEGFLKYDYETMWNNFKSRYPKFVGWFRRKTVLKQVV